MKIFTREVKIALVAIAGVVILFFGMNFLKGLTLFSNDTGYKVMFKDITGLSSSTPIYANGFAVGVVTGIQYNYDQKGDIVVTIDLDKNMRVPQGSTAPNSGQFLSPGDVIQGNVSKGALAQVADMVPSIERLLPKLDSILANVNAILANPAINQSLDNVQGLTANLRTTSQQLNGLVAGLNRSVPAMVGKANKVLDNTNTLTTNLAALDLDGTMQQVNRTLANVEEMTQKLNSNEGSLGLLMRDPTLYNNLNATLMSADSLLVNVRQHPKRYVHFSLFGRKDK